LGPKDLEISETKKEEENPRLLKSRAFLQTRQPEAPLANFSGRNPWKNMGEHPD